MQIQEGNIMVNKTWKLIAIFGVVLFLMMLFIPTIYCELSPSQSSASYNETERLQKLNQLHELVAQYKELQRQQDDVLNDINAISREMYSLFGLSVTDENVGNTWETRNFTETAPYGNPSGDKFNKDIEIPVEKKQKLITNGDFEKNLDSWEVGHSLDRQGSLWNCQIVYDEDKKSNVIQFKRSGSKNDGSSAGISQDVFIDLSQYDDVRLRLDVMPMFQSLVGGGWVGGEYPIMVQIAFIDQRGEPQTWTYGFLYDGEFQYENVTRVEQNAWFKYTSPNLKEVLPDCADAQRVYDMRVIMKSHEYKPPVIPTYITRILVYGSGWDFQGRADNVEFILSSKMINRNNKIIPLPQEDKEEFYYVFLLPIHWDSRVIFAQPMDEPRNSLTLLK
jgi:hypothetical protein